MIRPMTSTDIDVIVEQEEQVFGVSLGKQHYQQGMAIGATFGFVYDKNGIQAALLCWQNDTSVQIDNLYVVPKYQRQGIGRALLEAMFDDMKTRGLDSVSLEVAVSNKGAIQLYQSLGFVIEKTLPNYHPKDDAYRMMIQRSDYEHSRD